MKKTLIVLTVLLACASLSAFAQHADPLIAQKITPPAPGTKGFNVVRTLVIPYPTSWAHLSGAEKQLRMFNILSRISTQKGLIYISRRAGYKPKVLFEESQYIESLDARPAKPLADPVCTELSASVIRFAEQKDSTFGDTFYRLTFTNVENETLLEVRNVTAMKFHGITCISAEEMSMYTSVMQSSKGIVLTSATAVRNHDKDVQILFMNVDIADSFSRRIDALFTWYRNQLALEK